MDIWCHLQKMRLLKASHDQLLNELELANRSLQTEQAKVVGMQNQLKQSSSSHFANAEVRILLKNY